MVTCISSGESEAARGSTALRDDTVVVIEDFLFDFVSKKRIYICTLGGCGRGQLSVLTYVDIDVDADSVVLHPG